MTEVVATSSQQSRHHPALAGPLSRPSIPTRSADVLSRKHGSSSDTPSTVPPLSSSSAPAPQPESHRESSIKRKRAASIDTEEANRPKIQSLTLRSPANVSPRPFDTSGVLICLCTPEPKVPRPRNAFILYRQHRQAGVVQQNPGLANPEISKIIGELWRDEPEEHKIQWKRLAEEEKQRHQQQYPNYRYQPRRGNKAGGTASSTPTPAPGEDPSRCPKCGGRYIATPRTPTPSTPFMTPAATKASAHSAYNPSSSGRNSTPSKGDTSRSSRPPHAGGSSSGVSSGLYDIKESHEGMMSAPEAKRRRYNAAGSYHNYHALPSPPLPFGSGHHGRQSSVGGPSSSSGYGLLPGPSSMLARASPVPMHPPPPPPRPPQGLPQYVSSRGGGLASDFDESLRLPPLQTHLPTSPDSEPSAGPGPGPGGGGGALGILNPPPTIPNSSYGGGHQSHREAAAQAQAHARSVEAMVMSIPYINKLRVLERISPPLASDWPRGPIIAVEGPDARLLRLVAGVIERALTAASDDWEVRCWEDGPSSARSSVAGTACDGGEDMAAVTDAKQPASRHGSHASITTTITSTTANPTAQNTAPNPLAAYLTSITAWHAKSAEITAFVAATTPSSSSTHHPRTTSIASSSSLSGCSSLEQQQQPQQQQPPTTAATATGTDRHPLLSQPTPSTATTNTNPTAITGTGTGTGNNTTGTGTSATKKLPIALLPSGYALTLSDRSACSVPIADAYAPVDHWQWMATLWRGVVGADLVVYVRPVRTSTSGGLPLPHTNPNTNVPAATTSSSAVVGAGGGVGSGGAGTSIAGEDVTGPGLGLGMGSGVEVKSSALIVVRVGTGGGDRVGGGLDEKMERRLGFEVVEWVRAAAWEGRREGLGLEY